MNVLKTRAQLIVQHLLDQEQPITVGRIAKHFHVSPRTVRYDLDEIEYWLRKREIILKKAPHKGIWIEDVVRANEMLEKVFTIKVDQPYRYYSKEERQKIILGQLFDSKEYVIVEELANLVNVSKSTCYKDVAELEIWLRERKIELLKVPNKGIRLKAEERDWRRGLIDYLDSSLGDKQILELLRVSRTESTRLQFLLDHQLKTLFSSIDFLIIEELIFQIQESLDVEFVDTAFAGLMIHIAIALDRLKSGEVIEMPEERLNNLVGSLEFEVIQQLLEDSPLLHDQAVPAAEIGYITIHVLAAKLRKTHRDENGLKFGDRDAVMLDVIREYISKVSLEIGVDLTTDPSLMESMLLHVRPLIRRLEFGLRNRNPLLKELKSNYPVIFRACSQWAKLFNEAYQIELDEHEVGFLTMHLGASIERRVKTDRKKGFSVAVVCSSGIGTSKMLSSRLAYEFKEIDSLEEFSVLEMKEVDFKKYDLVISTIPVELEAGIKVIEASPLLQRSEIEEIQRFLSAQDEHRFQSVNAKVSEVYQIIQKHCEIRDMDQLIQDLGQAFSKNGKKSASLSEGAKTDLWDYLNRHTVRIERVKTDLKNAVRKTAQPLITEGKIEDRYVEAMLKLVETMPKHMVLCKGFFMPHAAPIDGVNETSMSLMIFQNAIETEFETDGIHAVLVVAAEDDSKHMRAMQQLVDILNHPNLVDQLKTCRDEEEVLRVLKRIV